MASSTAASCRRTSCCAAPYGLAKLGDLALAKELEATVSQQVTRPGKLVGNIYYMSPERTQPSLDIDGRSDLFSLGVTLYQALTGKLPFTGVSLPEVIGQIRQATPMPVRQIDALVPEPLERMVAKMLGRQPEDRYPSAGALLGDLSQLAKAERVAV
jgi:serine/threonine-protein kinase